MTRLSEYKNDGGSIYKGISRPSGLWYGHDLSWVRYMDKRKSWSPQISPKGIPVLTVYNHVFGTQKVPAPEEGDTFQDMKRYPPHYVYTLPIPDDAFVSPVYAGPDRSKKVMKITPITLAEWIETLKQERANWYTNSAAIALDASYGGADPLGSAYFQQGMWKTGNGKPDDAYIHILKYLITTDAFDKKKKTRAQSIIDGAKDVPLIDLKSSKEIREEIAKGVFEGKIPMDTEEIQLIEDLFWQPIIQKISAEWGGMDFADELFTKDEYFKVFPMLRFLDAGSGVLFKPADVLGSKDATKDIMAVISWDAAVENPPAPNYVFRLTQDGKIRIAPSGGYRNHFLKGKQMVKTRSMTRRAARRSKSHCAGVKRSAACKRTEGCKFASGTKRRFCRTSKNRKHRA